MAFGLFSDWRLRIAGTRVRRLLTTCSWLGSLRRGMGPPPWQIAITGARMIDLGKAWPFNVVARDKLGEQSHIYIEGIL